MPNLLTPLPFLDASGQPANGFIFAQATRTFSTADGFITTARSMGRVVNGVFLTADDSKSDPFVLVTATADAPLSIVIKLDSYTTDGRLVKDGGGVASRTVTVPDVGTVTWLDLVDVVAVADAVPYVIQPWMQDAMDNAASASASAATATTKAGEAAASAASIVRGGANGVAPLDAGSRVPDANLPTRLGASELSTTFAPSGVVSPHRNRPRMLPDALGAFELVKPDAIPLAAGTWRSTYTFIGGDIVLDPVTNTYALMYASFDTTSNRQTIGLAYSDDLLTWTDYGSNPVFGNNPTTGQPDSGGTTFPQLAWEDGVWHMFYIGFTDPGFEVGAATVLRATAPALTGPWTRQGVALAPTAGTWASSLVYKPNVFKHNGLWYMFTNGGPTPGEEVIGYATADTLAGPWTLAAAPSVTAALTGLLTHADPDVFRIDDTFYMLFWSHYGTYLASTSVESFPSGWEYGGRVIENFGGSEFTQTTARPVSVMTPAGLTVFTCRGGYPTGMDIYRSSSADLPPMGGRVDMRGGGEMYLLDTGVWGDMYPSSPTFVLSAKVGDWVEVGISGLYGNQAQNGGLDVVSVVGGVPVNAWSENGPENNTHNGVSTWQGLPNVFSPVGGSIMRQITADDLEVGGKLTLKLRTHTTPAGTKSMFMSDASPFTMWAMNRRGA